MLSFISTEGSVPVVQSFQLLNREGRRKKLHTVCAVHETTQSTGNVR